MAPNVIVFSAKKAWRIVHPKPCDAGMPFVNSVEQPFRVDFRFQVSQHSIEWHGPRKNTSAEKISGRSCWGVMEARYSWKHSGCESTVQISIELEHLLITNAVLLCADKIILYDIDTLIFYDDIMLILWHCVTRCIRFPFLSPIFMHLQGPQNVMLIFSSFVLSSVSMVRIRQTKLRQEAGVTVETPQQHWSWARNINQLHFLKGLHKNINQQSHHAVWSDLDSHIKVLKSHGPWPFLHRMVVWS